LWMVFACLAGILLSLNLSIQVRSLVKYTPIP
jgi:hypothetical protein